MTITLRTRKPPYDREAARRHLLASDATMRQLAEDGGPCLLVLRGGPYQTLLRAILYQQLAGAAASAIERRLLALWDDRVPKPEQLLAMPVDRMRAVGLSRQKASYLRSLAEHAAAGHLQPRAFRHANDDEVIDAVTQISGVGRWTADMLLMFCLGRPDIMPVGDLGLRRMVQEAYSLDDLPDAAAMLEIAEPWRPYRSVAAWYLWRHGDVITADVSL